MDHNTLHHSHQLVSEPHAHWNYGSPSTTGMSTPLTSTPISGSKLTSQNNTWTPPATRGLKRALSDSEGDDLYSEESSKGHLSSVEGSSCHLTTRKKRRGVIEKKRRDRINSSLCELKRLVPSAFEKQGSAKLEKAEILQLTVDHLKTLHSKGADAFDPQRIALDYHVVGFRECASEVARYLVTIEGMDIQDPLRLRLMSHLQCFVAQRQLGVKSAEPCPSWSSYQANGYSNQGYQPYAASSAQHESVNSFNSPFATSHSSAYLNSSEYASSGYGTANNTSVSTSVVDASASATASSPVPNQTPASGIGQSETQPVYTDLSSPHDRMLNLGGSYQTYGNQLYAGQGNASFGNNNNSNMNNNSKPYRPWHPEMAY